MLWAIALPRNEVLRAGGERPRPAAPPMKVMNSRHHLSSIPELILAGSGPSAAPNAETILRFVVMEGDVLHPQLGKRMAYPDPPNARANASSGPTLRYAPPARTLLRPRGWSTPTSTAWNTLNSNVDRLEHPEGAKRWHSKPHWHKFETALAQGRPQCSDLACLSAL